MTKLTTQGPLFLPVATMVKATPAPARATASHCNSPHSKNGPCPAARQRRPPARGRGRATASATASGTGPASEAFCSPFGALSLRAEPRAASASTRHKVSKQCPSPAASHGARPEVHFALGGSPLAPRGRKLESIAHKSTPRSHSQKSTPCLRFDTGRQTLPSTTHYQQVQAIHLAPTEIACTPPPFPRPTRTARGQARPATRGSARAEGCLARPDRRSGRPSGLRRPRVERRDQQRSQEPRVGAQMAPPPASRTTRTLRTRPHSLSLAFAPAPRARRFLLVGGKRGLAAPRNAVVADMELNLDIKKSNAEKKANFLFAKLWN